MKKKLLLLLLLPSMSAFSQSGVLDTSFGTNGKVITALGTNNNWANAVSVLPNSKFLVGGAYVSAHGEIDFALARFNANGTLDTAFGIDGKVVTSFLNNGHNYSFINSIHPQPDGKFIVLGTSGMASVFSKLAIVRYNADGSIDSGFGSNGKIISNLWPNSLSGNKLVFLSDGSFIVTSANLYVATQNYDIGVEKYTANGTPDTSFGTNGQVITSFGTGLNNARSTPAAIALKADGKFVIGGSYFQNNTLKMAVAQFNANGTLDTTFDADGKVLTNFGAGASSQGFQVFTGADGKITVAGGVNSNTATSFGLARYNANGTLDTAFDNDGMALYAFAANDDYSVVENVALQPNGKFVVVCKPVYFMLESSDFVIRRFNTDATIDTAFGTNGKASVTFDTGANEAQFAALTPDGDIIVTGKSTPLDAEHTEFGIAKFGANGIIDTSFGSNGKQTVAYEKGNDELAILLALPDDKLISIGSSGYRQSNNFVRKHIVLAKYNADGSPDVAFGTLGKVYSVFNDNINTVVAATLQPDGKIVVGNTYYNYSQNFYSYEVIRYNANGSLDTSFGTEGKVGVSFVPASIVIQPNGKIIVAGESYLGDGLSAFNAARFNTNGTLDAGFGTNGYAIVSYTGSAFTSATTLLQPDGKIVMFGSVVNNDSSMVLKGLRFNANGTTDTAFGDNGTLILLPGAYAYLSYKCFLQPDGKIIVAGRGLGTEVNFTTMRFTANGAIDTTYGTDGVISTYLSEYREIKAVILQPDNKFLVALSKYNAAVDSYDFKVRRFNIDGTFDADFSDQDGLTTSFYNGYDEAFSIALQSDYKIVVAGSTHNGISKEFAMARYTNEVLGVGHSTENNEGLVIYPNPVKSTLHIQAGIGIAVIDYTIYNMLGQEVSKGLYRGSGLETDSFPKGIYSINITTTKGTVTKNFIKE
ncbi:MAG: T9SS type A sorting domain-containing protein [Bacteroidota bacterium]